MSSCVKFCIFIEEFCSYLIAQIVELECHPLRDIAVQIECMLSCSICPNDVSKPRPIQCTGGLARIEWENIHLLYTAISS